MRGWGCSAVMSSTHESLDSTPSAAKKKECNEVLGVMFSLILQPIVVVLEVSNARGLCGPFSYTESN